jgi:hypothetical protein
VLIGGKVAKIGMIREDFDWFPCVHQPIPPLNEGLKNGPEFLVVALPLQLLFGPFL